MSKNNSSKSSIRMSNGKFVCEFCKNEYKTMVSLRNHQLRATFCKHIRGEPVILKEENKKEDKKNNNNNDVKELLKKIEEQAAIIKKLEEELKQFKIVEHSDSFEKNIIKKLENKFNREELISYLTKSNILLS